MQFMNKLCTFLALWISVSAHCQLPAALVLLRGKVMEHTDSAYHQVGHCQLFINSYGNCQTKLDGSFEIKVPHENQNLKVEVRQPGYTVVHPRDGTILLEGLPSRDTTIDLNILILREDELNQWQEFEQVKEKLAQLEQESQLTQRQLNRINEALVDTILHFQERKYAQEKQIASLESGLQSSEEERERAASVYMENLESMDDSIQNLMVELFDALEERYLLQKEYYDQISGDLATYISRTKDIRDQLKSLEMVFQSVEGSGDFRQLIIDYNEIYEKLNEDQEGDLEAIDHYWENDAITREAEELFEFILDDIHRKTIFNPLNDEIIPLIQEAAVGRRPKSKKAARSAAETAAELDTLLEKLDKKMNLFISQLSIF